MSQSNLEHFQKGLDFSREALLLYIIFPKINRKPNNSKTEEERDRPGPQDNLEGKRCLQVPLSSHDLVTDWVHPRGSGHLSITNSWSPPKLMSSESVMPSNHLILCCLLLLLPSVFPSIRVFPKESALRIRWPKYGSFSFNVSPSDEYSELISFRID